jgi:hypothetical protein
VKILPVLFHQKFMPKNNRILKKGFFSSFTVLGFKTYFRSGTKKAFSLSLKADAPNAHRTVKMTVEVITLNLESLKGHIMPICCARA